MSEFKVGDRVRVKESVPVNKAVDVGTVTRVLPPRPNNYDLQVSFGNTRLFLNHDEVAPVNDRGYVITRDELEDLLTCNDRAEREKIVNRIIEGGA